VEVQRQQHRLKESKAQDALKKTEAEKEQEKPTTRGKNEKAGFGKEKKKRYNFYF
jgi:hypothetical protein